MRCRAMFAVWSHLCKASLIKSCKDTREPSPGGLPAGRGAGEQWVVVLHWTPLGGI